MEPEEVQTVPESKKFRIEKSDKENNITMQLIFQSSVDSKASASLSEEERIEIILSLKSIHLEWLNIQRINNLEVFEELTVLYLQHNAIREIEGLDNLRNLQYLALNDNLITKVVNLRHLVKLQGLNMANNQIAQLNHQELPPNLSVVKFQGNPLSLQANYKVGMVSHLKFLELLDDMQIKPTDRFMTMGLFPQHLKTYADQLKKFKTKGKETKNSMGQMAPSLQMTDEQSKVGVGQIRDKTSKLLAQNKQAFRLLEQEQIDNFEEKIKVSRNIRKIKEEEEVMRQTRLKAIKEGHTAP